ncbi:Malignant T-cell-amplified sequence 1 [Trichoplax sp. H2]|nr:Malignant T-cell-amplified sequence 1 [Trichoplax sp. H2]|eukprot:RDD41711.1 Malignant T-cell-amplified sequence 1 [Trichoplax sp. H2]
MFKKFDSKQDIVSSSQVKSSVQRGIRAKVLQQFPDLQDYIDDILPKKAALILVKCHDHIEIVSINTKLLFFRQRDGPFFPTLRLLHQYPFILPQQQVDRGAIRFILSGANIMCPGLTSPGGKMVPTEEETIVAVMAEGKQHAISIGKMKLSSENIAKINKGIAIENIHFLGDGLWYVSELEK